MRDSINAEAIKNVSRDTRGVRRNRLYADKYEPCIFQDRPLLLPERGRYMLKKEEWKVEQTVHENYDCYLRFFSLKSDANIAVGAVEYYGEVLHRYMEPVFGEMDKYCKATGQEALYNRLSKVASECYSFLLQGLQEELKRNMARYALRPVSYYVRLANLRLAHLREKRKKDKTARTVLGCKDEISASAVCEALFDDCKERLECFTRKAQHRYEAYVEVLRLWLGSYRINLPEYADGEEWKIFCHALARKGEAFCAYREEANPRWENKYAAYVPCGCGEKTCKTWGTGDEADYEISKWYGMWYGEDGECFELTEETIGGKRYRVKRCYKDALPQGECTHVEFLCEEDSDELWTMHAGQNLLGLAGEESKLYYIVLENMERQILRAYCEKEKVLAGVG